MPANSFETWWNNSASSRCFSRVSRRRFLRWQNPAGWSGGVSRHHAHNLSLALVTALFGLALFMLSVTARLTALLVLSAVARAAFFMLAALARAGFFVLSALTVLTLAGLAALIVLVHRYRFLRRCHPRTNG